MKRILALLLMAAALCVSPFGAAVQAKDSSSTIQDVVKRGTLRVGFSSFVPWAMQDKEGKYIRRERYTGSCSRSFYVGEGVTQDEIRAMFEDGILRLTVPKKEKKQVEENKYISIEG